MPAPQDTRQAYNCPREWYTKSTARQAGQERRRNKFRAYDDYLREEEARKQEGRRTKARFMHWMREELARAQAKEHAREERESKLRAEMREKEENSRRERAEQVEREEKERKANEERKRPNMLAQQRAIVDEVVRLEVEIGKVEAARRESEWKEEDIRKGNGQRQRPLFCSHGNLTATGRDWLQDQTRRSALMSALQKEQEARLREHESSCREQEWSDMDAAKSARMELQAARRKVAAQLQDRLKKQALHRDAYLRQKCNEKMATQEADKRESEPITK